jgi:hypothetical protein
VTARIARDGGLLAFEVKGSLALTLHDEAAARARVLLRRGDDAAFSYQPHPNINKAALGAPGGEGAIAHKQPERPFPTGAPFGVLRWRFASKDADAAQLPLMITCWPEEAGGVITVSVEYTLQREDIALADLVVTVPLGAGAEPPKVAKCDGVYKHAARDGALAWRVEAVSVREGTATGGLEFSVKAGRGVTLDSFFPVRVSFSSPDTLSGLRVLDVVAAEDGKQLRHSVASGLSVDEYLVE